MNILHAYDVFDIPPEALTAAGQALAAEGMALAAAHGGNDAERFELRFLKALLASPDGATTDDAASDAELIGQRPRKGKYVGAVVNRLAKQRVIAAARAATGTRHYVPSRRPARHATPIAVWRLADPCAAARRIAQIRAALTASENEAND